MIASSGIGGYRGISPPGPMIHRVGGGDTPQAFCRALTVVTGGGGGGRSMGDIVGGTVGVVHMGGMGEIEGSTMMDEVGVSVV